MKMLVAAAASSEMGSEHYCLRWNNHQSNLLGVFSQLLQDESLVDVTLACSEGVPIRAHKVVLSACSSYFRSLFLDHPSRHPIVILKDVRFTELRTIIEFMYKGEVNVEYCQLPALLKIAESLKVKGLADMTTLSAAGIETPSTVQANQQATPATNTEHSRNTSAQHIISHTSQHVISRLSPEHTNRRDDMEWSGDGNGPGSDGGVDQPLHKGEPPPNDDGINLTNNTKNSRTYSPTQRPYSPCDREPIAGPSGLPPVQQVPLSLKKEVDWDRNTEEPTMEVATDYRIQHDPESYDGGGRRGVDGDNRVYPCTYCGAVFTHQSKLARHILLSHSLETVKYSVLGRPIPIPVMGHLSDYQSIQPDEPPLELDGIGPIEPGNVVLCKFCGKSFPDVSSLIAHLPVHTGDRPFKCEFCGKAFKLRHHMKDHCRVHTGERPFRCALCGKTFSRSTILKAHEKTHYPKYVRKFLSPSPVDTEEESPHQ